MNLNNIIEKIYTGENRYHGSEVKLSVSIDDHLHMLKLQDPKRGKRDYLSYINNALSEYIGCKIFESVGLPVQQVVFGTFDYKGKTRFACACKDLCNENEEHFQIDIALRGEFPDNPEIIDTPSFESFEKILESIPVDNKEEVRKFYYDMFIVDAFTGNIDRHNGNWGIIKNRESGKTRISPVYDCGSCLDSLLDDSQLSEETVKQSIHNTYSVIQDKRGKINYKDFFLNSKNPVFINEIKNIVPKININKIFALIDSAEEISEKRKNYYKSVLEGKYSLFIIPCLKKATSLDIKNNTIHNNKETKHCFDFIQNEIISPLKQLDIHSRGVIEIFGKKISFVKPSKKDVILYLDNQVNMFSLKRNAVNLENIINVFKCFDIDLEDKLSSKEKAFDENNIDGVINNMRNVVNINLDSDTSSLLNKETILI